MKVVSILVPVDFSGCSTHALSYARVLAEALGASLDVLHVWHLSAYSDLESELAKSQERELRAKLDEVARSVAGVAVRTHLGHGAPHEVILQKSVALKASMVVMGTSAKTGFEHFLLGSVAERIVRESRVPVVTVRS